MAGVKVTRFYGMIPRLAEELIPVAEQQGVNYAVEAINTKLSSGNIEPYRVPLTTYTPPAGSIDNEVRSLRRIDSKNGSSNDDVWLLWEDDVDLVIGTQTDTKFKYNGGFYYYTSDVSYPRMSYGDLLLGNESYDNNLLYPRDIADHGGIEGPAQFALGIPAPEDALTPTAQVQAFSPKQSQGFERDSSNFATITTQEPHGLRTGNLVSIDGFGERTITDPIVVPPTEPEDPVIEE